MPHSVCFQIVCVAFIQVRLVLGPAAWSFPVDMLKTITYFAVQIQRWDGRREIHLPSDTEFGFDLGMLIDTVRMANKVDGWEKLIPTSYTRMLKFILLADYLGADCVLDDFAKFMGTHASKIDGRNPRGKVHLRVRNAYRMANYLHKRQRSTAENCQICRKSVIPKPPILPVTFQFPCCKTYIHAVCGANCPYGKMRKILHIHIRRRFSYKKAIFLVRCHFHNCFCISIRKYFSYKKHL